MKATPFEFRFRIFIAMALYIIGFWAPWTRYGAVAPATTLWLAASATLARFPWLPLADAALLVTALAILFALAGAALRIWGTAYLGSAIVHSASMYAGDVMASGPYRHVRNPLYLGTFLFSVGVCILMPPTGALFFVLASAIFYFRLILGEEHFLTLRLGEPYEEYRRRVPRLIPSLRARIPASAVTPRWGQSLLAEIYSVGFSLCLAILAWRYQPQLLIRCLLICFGLSLVSRALLTKPVAAA
jgi:protein-S-isoprenylcysteine O-methyltransferase Ste14